MESSVVVKAAGGGIKARSLITGQVAISSGSSTQGEKIDDETVSIHDSSSSTSRALNERNEKEENSIQEFKQVIQSRWEKQQDTLLRGAENSVPRKDDFLEVFDNLKADKPQLQRILIARNYEMEACADLFFEQLRFRARWKPQTILPEDISKVLASGAWRISGYSKENIIVSNYKIRYWRPEEYIESKDGDLDDAVNKYVKYVLFMLEGMIARMKDDPLVPQKFMVLFDLKGFSVSLAFRKDVRLMIRKLIYIAQAQYPERLYKALLINAPTGFETAWRLIRPLLDEKTAEKVKFVKEKTLREEIYADVLSNEYGGNHDEYPLPGGQ